MTEAEWLACEDGRHVLYSSSFDTSIRQQRLFAVACCRRIEDLVLRFKGAWRAVILAERIADGERVSDEAIRLREHLPGAAFSWIDGYREEKENKIMWHAANAAAGCLAATGESADLFRMPLPGLDSVAALAAGAVGHRARRNDREPASQKAIVTERAAQLVLLRDIISNPFRPVAFSREWRTDTTVSLARQMYESREFSAMPILADALQDAGCDNDEILSHCRDAQHPHVRGCWVVDLVLGKE